MRTSGSRTGASSGSSHWVTPAHATAKKLILIVTALCFTLGESKDGISIVQPKGKDALAKALKEATTEKRFTDIWVDNSADSVDNVQLGSLFSYSAHHKCNLYVYCGVPTKTRPRPERLPKSLICKVPMKMYNIQTCKLGQYNCSTYAKVIGSAHSPPPLCTVRCKCNESGSRFTDKPSSDQLFQSVVAKGTTSTAVLFVLPDSSLVSITLVQRSTGFLMFKLLAGTLGRLSTYQTMQG